MASLKNIIQLGNGNVGIGTISPDDKLVVAGVIKSIGGTNNGKYSQILVNDSYAYYTTNASVIYMNKELQIDTGFIGSYDEDLSLRTSGTTRIRIQNSTGNVGIGTTSPNYKLEVVGGSVNTQIARFITADYPSHSVGLGVDSQSTYWGASIFQDDIKRFTVDSTGGILVGGNYQGSNAPANGAAIEGNVGIGTTSPATKFHLQGSNLMATFRNSSTEVNQYAQLEFIAGSRDAYIWLGNQNTTSWAGDGGLNIYTGTGDMVFWTAATQKMRLTASGNLGIGTTSPQKKLDVRGGYFITSDGGTNEVSFVQGGNGYAYFGNLNAGKAAFGNSENWTTLVADGGNVGIGTTIPTQKLDVDGNVVATLFGGRAYPYNSVLGSGADASTGTVFAGSTDGYVSSIDVAGGGATNPNTIIIKTASAERMRITNAGNVGIGTTSPVGRLHLTGDYNGAQNTLNLENNWPNTYPTSLINFWAYYNTSNPQAVIEAGQDVSATNAGVISFKTMTSGAAPSTKMIIKPDGNVGIGTTSPGSTLSVNGTNTASVPLLDLTASGSGAWQRGVRMLNTGMSAGDSIMMAVGNRDNSKNMGQFYFYYAGNASNSNRISMGLHSVDDVFNILATGNVGIGTTSPGQKLQVDGSLLVNAGTSAAAYRDIMMGGIGGWSTGESHGIDTVYGTAANPTTFSRIESYFDGTNGKIRFRNLYNASAARTDILMTIQGNGNVGIGTDSPDRKLDIEGDVSTNALPLLRIHNTNTAWNTYGLIETGSDAVTSGVRFGFWRGTGGDSGANGFVIQTGTNTNLLTTPVTRMFVANNGLVGIGTTAPTDPLTIGGGQTGLSINSATTGDPYVRWRLDGTVYTDAYVDRGTGNFIMGPSVGAALVFKTNATEKVRITSAGNVGIGTTSPQTKLNIDIGSGGANGTAAFRIGGVSNYPSLELGIVGNYGGMVRSYGNDLHYYAGHWRTVGTAATEDHSHYWYTSKNGSTDWSTPKMELDHNGNLGIGTTSPGARLDVAGQIRQTGGGDYWYVSSAATAYFQGGEVTLSRSSAGYVSAVPNKNFKKFKASVAFKTTTSTHLGIVFAAQDEGIDDNNYAVILRSVDTIRVQKRASGNQTYPISEISIAAATDINDGNWHTISMAYDGSFISVDVDGVNYISQVWTDTTWTGSGKVGLHIYDGTVEFNEFICTETTSKDVASTMLISNDVGIGTTSPTTKLHIAGSDSEGLLIAGGTNGRKILLSSTALDFYTTTTSGWAMSNRVLKASDGSVLAHISGAFGTENAISYTYYGGTAYNAAVMYINGSSVGIGTSNPSTRLYVDGGESTFNRGNSDGAIARFRGKNAEKAVIGTIDSWFSSNVGIGVTDPEKKLEVKSDITYDGILIDTLSAPEIVLRDRGNSDTLVGTGRHGLDSFHIDTYSGNAFFIKGDTRNVGIGTTSPDEKLHVGGNLKVVGSIYAEPEITINGNTDDTKQLLFKTGGNKRWNFYTDGAEPGSEVGSDLKLSRHYDNGESIEDVLLLKRTNGYFGIGTNPSERLSVSGNIYIDAGSLGVNVTPNATDGRIDASNDIVAYQTSDKRLKENITPIENALDKVKSLTGVEFDWIEETKHVHGYDGHDVGIIAQDVQAVLPTAVRTNETGYLSVRYEKMIALLVEAMKEQQTQIDELKAKLDGLTK